MERRVFFPPPLPGLVGRSRTNVDDRVVGGETQRLIAALRLLDTTLQAWDRADAALIEMSGLTNWTDGQARGRVLRAHFRVPAELETVIDALYRTARLAEALRRSSEFVALASMPVPTASERDRLRDFRTTARLGALGGRRDRQSTQPWVFVVHDPVTAEDRRRRAAALATGVDPEVFAFFEAAARACDPGLSGYLEHAHPDLVAYLGHIGRGVATLRIDASGVDVADHERIETVRLEFADLARMIEQLHDFLRAATKPR